MKNLEFLKGVFFFFFIKLVLSGQILPQFLLPWGLEKQMKFY